MINLVLWRPYKWPYKWVNGVTDPSKWSHNPILMIGRSTPCMTWRWFHVFFRNCTLISSWEIAFPFNIRTKNKQTIGGGFQYMYFFSISYFGKLIHFDYDNFFEKGVVQTSTSR